MLGLSSGFLTAQKTGPYMTRFLPDFTELNVQGATPLSLPSISLSSWRFAQHSHSTDLFATVAAPPLVVLGAKITPGLRPHLSNGNNSSFFTGASKMVPGFVILSIRAGAWVQDQLEFR